MRRGKPKVEWLLTDDERSQLQSSLLKYSFHAASQPPQGGFFVPFAISVAPARASEAANRRPANPRQHTTSGLECSRGQQRTEREKRRNAHRKLQIPEGRAQEAKAGNRANTGVSGKKKALSPNRVGG
jgi:hypothetical protein